MSRKGRKREQRKGVLPGAIVFFVYAADQLTKFFALRSLAQISSLPLIRGAVHLTLIKNTGVAFGLLRHHPVFSTAVSVVASLIILLIFIRKRGELTFIQMTALSLIMAGTIGNLTDRLRLGYVVDFIDLRVWPVFNIADSGITVGTVLLIAQVSGVFGRKKMTGTVE